MQIIFNILRQRPIDLFFELAQKKNVAILARVPLASGMLSGKFTRASTFDKADHRNFNRSGEFFDVGETFSGMPYDKGLEVVEKIRPLVTNGDMAQFALRWILMFDAVSVVIPGSQPRRSQEPTPAHPICRLYRPRRWRCFAPSTRRTSNPTFISVGKAMAARLLAASSPFETSAGREAG